MIGFLAELELASILMGAYNIKQGYDVDGCKAGAAIGSYFEGIEAVPGAAIGSVVGGLAPDIVEDLID